MRVPVVVKLTHSVASDVTMPVAGCSVSSAGGSSTGASSAGGSSAGGSSTGASSAGVSSAGASSAGVSSTGASSMGACSTGAGHGSNHPQAWAGAVLSPTARSDAVTERPMRRVALISCSPLLWSDPPTICLTTQVLKSELR